MKFGLYFNVSVPRPFKGETERKALDDCLEQAVLADELGFDYCWAGEHHFLEEFAHLSAPDIFLAAVAARTSRIRLGACVLAGPGRLTHPAVLAERASVLDLISHGRMDFAAARARTWSELGALGDAQGGDAWEETVRALPALWTNERASLSGTHFTMPGRAVLPKPYQTPHPPMWAAVSGAAGAREAASLGLGCLMLDLAADGDERALVGAYRDRIGSAQPAGRFVNDQVATTSLLYCHEDRALAAETGARLLRTHTELAAQHATLAPARPAGGTADASLAVGDPRTIIECVRSWEMSGVDCMNFIVNAGEVVPHGDVLASLNLFAAEVMPAFKRARARAAAE